MAIPITINLPANLVESAQLFGEATGRELSDVLVETLEMILPTFNHLSEISLQAEISHLLDREILELANLKMDAGQNQHLGELQSQGKNSGLTAGQRYELLILISIYQIGQLRKSEGLAEAVRRGLITPLLP